MTRGSSASMIVRLLQRGVLPLPQQRMREQRLQVAAGGAVGGDAVGAEAERHRRVEHVGQRELAAKKRPALTEAAPPLVPDRDRRARCRARARPTRAARRRARVCTSSSRCAAPENPECISAHTDRAQARATGSAGHMPGCRSARYSAIASESQTTVAPSCRQGTRAVGENAQVRGVGRSRGGQRHHHLANGARESIVASQPRSDHDE